MSLTGSLGTVSAKNSGTGSMMLFIEAKKTVLRLRLSERGFKCCPTAETSNLSSGKTKRDFLAYLKSTECQM